MQLGRPSSGSELLAPARIAASFSSIAAEVLHVNSTTLGATGVSPSGAKTTAAGSLGKSRNAGNFFRTNVAEIEHHAQRRFGFLHAIRRKLNVVRVGAHGAIEMIGRHGVKRAPRGGQPPETASGGLGAGKFCDARRVPRPEM